MSSGLAWTIWDPVFCFCFGFVFFFIYLTKMLGLGWVAVMFNYDDSEILKVVIPCIVGEGGCILDICM